jgi:GTPase SAR1 family protein
MAGAADAANFGGKTSVRIVVVGEPGTGKSSLIVTAAADAFPDTTPPVLPPTRLPPDVYPDRVPITIIDTSSRYGLFLMRYRSAVFVLLMRNLFSRSIPIDELGLPAVFSLLDFNYWMNGTPRLETGFARIK